MLPDFSSYNLEWVARTPRWRDYYLAHDQTPHYAYMKTVLQILQWYRPRERWVLKSPQHLEQIGPLMTTFPDATIVVTHRDPVAVVQSTITMICYGARTAYRPTRPEWYRDYWTDRIGRLLDASLRDRPLLPGSGPTMCSSTNTWQTRRAPSSASTQSAGMPFTEEARQEIDAYQEAHPRGKEGRVVYDLRSDFAIDPRGGTIPVLGVSRSFRVGSRSREHVQDAGRPSDRHPPGARSYSTPAYDDRAHPRQPTSSTDPEGRRRPTGR